MVTIRIGKLMPAIGCRVFVIQAYAKVVRVIKSRVPFR
jgi:hypothetical protein